MHSLVGSIESSTGKGFPGWTLPLIFVQILARYHNYSLNKKPFVKVSMQIVEWALSTKILFKLMIHISSLSNSNNKMA